VGESNKKELTGVPVFWDAIGGVYVCPVPEGERPERYVISVADYEAYDALQSQLAHLTQQRDELEADAARYLWLEERAPIITATPEGDYCVWQITFHSPYGVKANECDLDEAIDAALTLAGVSRG
jgi:hypothetical protein